MAVMLTRITSPRKIDQMIDPQFHWGLMIRLAVMHFVLLTLACYAPVAIVLYFWGFPSHFATYWLSQYMSLQLPCLWLLAVFWSISRCEWRQRTFLAVVGYLTIGLHATAPFHWYLATYHPWDLDVPWGLQAYGDLCTYSSNKSIWHLGRD